MSSPLPKPVLTTRTHKVKVWAEELLSYTPRMRRIGSMLEPIQDGLERYRTDPELTEEEVRLAAAALEEVTHSRVATIVASSAALVVTGESLGWAGIAPAAVALALIYFIIALSKVSGVGLEAVIKHRSENGTL